MCCAKHSTADGVFPQHLQDGRVARGALPELLEAVGLPVPDDFDAITTRVAGYGEVLVLSDVLAGLCCSQLQPRLVLCGVLVIPRVCRQARALRSRAPPGADVPLPWP